jgi:hypothetical protein
VVIKAVDGVAHLEPLAGAVVLADIAVDPAPPILALAQLLVRTRVSLVAIGKRTAQGSQTVLTAEAGWTTALSIELVALAELSTVERGQEAVETRRAVILWRIAWSPPRWYQRHVCRQIGLGGRQTSPTEVRQLVARRAETRCDSAEPRSYSLGCSRYCTKQRRKQEPHGVASRWVGVVRE